MGLPCLLERCPPLGCISREQVVLNDIYFLCHNACALFHPPILTLPSGAQRSFSFFFYFLCVAEQQLPPFGQVFACPFPLECLFPSHPVRASNLHAVWWCGGPRSAVVCAHCELVVLCSAVRCGVFCHAQDFPPSTTRSHTVCVMHRGLLAAATRSEE